MRRLRSRASMCSVPLQVSRPASTCRPRLQWLLAIPRRKARIQAQGTSPTWPGRAGRPGFETEGLALYLPPSIHWGNPLASARPYLDPRDEELAVTSPLAAELLALMDEPEGIPLEDLPDVIQQMLLGLGPSNSASLSKSGRSCRTHSQARPSPSGFGEDFASALSAAAEQRGPQFSAFAELHCRIRHAATLQVSKTTWWD